MQPDNNLYDTIFEAAGQKYNIDPALLKSQALQESGLDPKATNKDTGAAGIAQFIPSTAQSLGLKDPYDPQQAIDAQARLMAENLKRYGNVPDALSAYHGGTNPANWGPKTKDYVQKINASYEGSTPKMGLPSDELDTYISQGAPAAEPTPDISLPSDDLDSYLKAETKSETSPTSSVEKTTSPVVSALPVTLDESLSGYFHNLTHQAANAATFGLGDKASALGAAAANKLMGRTNLDFSDNYQNQLQQQKATDTAFSAAHPIASGTASVVGSFGGLKANPAAVIPSTLFGKMAQGAGQGLVLGGLSGEGQAPDTSFTEDASSIGSNALKSGIVGGLIPPVFAAGGGLVNAFTQHGISPETAELARTAEEKYAIPLSGPQLSNNSFVKYLASMTDKLPFSGAGARAEAQSQAVTKAVADQIVPAMSNPESLTQFAQPEEIETLQNATGLTTKYMSTARKVLGNMFNSVADNTTITPENINALGNKLAGISSEAGQVLTDPEIKPITNQINNIIDKVESDGTLSGDTYQALTRKGAPLDVASNSNNPNIRHYAGQIRTALDDALEASASPEDLGILRQARLGWKNMKTVQDVAAKAGIEGDVSPNLLLGAVRKSYRDMAYTGAGNLGEIARITQLMKEPPSSGTAERLTAMRFLGGLGEVAGVGGAGYAVGASPLTTLGAGAGLVGTGKGVNAFLNSDFYRNRVIQSAFSQPGVVGSFLNSPYATPAAVIGANKLQQLGNSQ